LVGAAAREQTTSAGPVYSRRQPEKTALYKVMQHHLLTFEQRWTDEASGHTLPRFATDELQHLPTDVPELHPARPPPRENGGGDDWLN